MTFVKPLKLSSKGFPQEILSTESVSLANLQLGGSLSASSASISGNLSVGNLSGASSVSSPSLFGNLSGATASLSSSVMAPSFFGNLTGATASVADTITAGNLTGASLVSASSLVGNLSGATAVLSSSVIAPSLSGNLSGATASLSSSVIAPSLSGNLSGATAVLTSSVIAPSLSGNLSATSASVTGTIVAGNLTGASLVSASSLSGNLSGTSANVTGTLTAGNVTAITRVVAPSLLGNLSGATASLSSSVVAPSLSGNLSGATASLSSSVVAPSLSGNLSGETASLSSSVAAPIFYGNLSGASASVSGNVSAANVIATAVSASSGAFSSLTSGRVVFAGSGGALSDDAGLMYNSATDALTVSGNLSAGNLSTAAVTASALISGSAGISISGAESTFSSATVSDLTATRIVFAGTLGALEDSAHLSFSGNILSVGSISIDASSGRISSLTDPSSAQDAATKSYVDNVAQGLDVKGSVRAATTANITLSGEQTIDGVSIVAGDRVLVKNQSSSWQNGIYVASASGWSRSDDMSAWAEFPGSFFFVEQGGSYADTGWVCTVDQGGTLGSTAVTFSQFSGAGAVTAGDGITVSGTQVSVNLKDADPGLEFASGELAVKLNASNPALSLASGLAVTLSGTTLDKDASGLKVLGLPSAFTIAGSAVSSDFSASNANILVGGISTSAGNASNLLTLNNLAVWSFTADGSISAGQPVYVSSGSKVKKAQATDPSGNDGFVVGVAMSGVSDGASVKVITSGVAPGVLSSATAGAPMYLNSDGGLTSDPNDIGSGERLVMVGIAMNSSDLLIQVRDFGQRAVS